MKKIISAIIGLSLTLTAISCGTTEVKGSGMMGSAPVLNTNDIVITNYQGRVMNSEIPAWIYKVSEGNKSAKAYEDLLPEIKGKKIFVMTANGTNVELLKNWVDLNLQSKVAESFETVIGTALQSYVEGSSKKGDGQNNLTEDELTKKFNSYKSALTRVRINGLEQISDYWLQIEERDKSGDVVDSYYSYYTIYGIDKKSFDKQLKDAIDSVEAKSKEDVEIKSIINQKLDTEMNSVSTIVKDSNEENKKEVKNTKETE